MSLSGLIRKGGFAEVATAIVANTAEPGRVMPECVVDTNIPSFACGGGNEKGPPPSIGLSFLDKLAIRQVLGLRMGDDPKRIDAVISAIDKAWPESPDLHYDYCEQWHELVRTGKIDENIYYTISDAVKKHRLVEDEL